MLHKIAIIIIGLALAYGAYTDDRYRKIPNKVPLIIMVCGCFTATAWAVKLSGLLLIILALAFAKWVTKAKSGGGDIKVYFALGFSLGFFTLGIILVGLILIKWLCELVMYRTVPDKKERFPLCVYLAASYIIIIWLPMIASFM